MSLDIQAPEEASAETQAILNELVAEGKGELPNTPAPQTEAPKVSEPAKPPVSEDTPPPAKASEPDDQIKTDPKPEVKPVERETRHVPVGKFNEVRKEAQSAKAELELERQARAELQAKLDATSTNKPATDDLSDVRDAATKLAEEHGYEPEFVTKFAETMVSLMGKRTSSTGLEQRLAAFESQQAERVAQQEAQINAANADKYFDAEFNEVVKKYPELSTQKEEIKELAFSDTYRQIPLRMIALEYREQNPPGRKTVEVPLQGKNDTPTLLDFENMSDEQFKTLNPEQQDKFYAWIESKGKR